MLRRSLLLALSATVLLAACAKPKTNVPVLPIAQIDRGVQIVLPNTVLFETGKATLNVTESAAYLDRVADLLNNKTDKNISVEGHTDSQGSLESNQKLSEARAKAVHDALLARGVKQERLAMVGFNFSKPVGDNKTEEGRAVNRRCEIIVLNEKVENITKGEEGTFSTAFASLKKTVDAGLTPATEAASGAATSVTNAASAVVSGVVASAVTAVTK